MLSEGISTYLGCTKHLHHAQKEFTSGYLPSSAYFTIAPWLNYFGYSEFTKVHINTYFYLLNISHIVLHAFPFTTNEGSPSYYSSKAPCGNTRTIGNGPNHLEFILLGNKQGLKLYNKNKSLGSKKFSHFFSWCIFILSLYMLELSYARSENSSNSFTLLSLDFVASCHLKFIFFNTYSVLYSSSTSNWHAFPYISDMGRHL